MITIMIMIKLPFLSTGCCTLVDINAANHLVVTWDDGGDFDLDLHVIQEQLCTHERARGPEIAVVFRVACTSQLNQCETINQVARAKHGTCANEAGTAASVIAIRLELVGCGKNICSDTRRQWAWGAPCVAKDDAVGLANLFPFTLDVRCKDARGNLQ